MKGSGYAEGTLFPWVSSDFSLMDAIECGIVKLPRVPVADNVQRDEMPIYRQFMGHIGKKMPKKDVGEKKPTRFCRQCFKQHWKLYMAITRRFMKAGKKKGFQFLQFSLLFVIILQSKLVYDFISGFDRANEKGEVAFHEGRLELFQNYDKNGQRLSKPRTLLIDSAQLESGDALDKEFREAGSPEIERFRREILERTGNQKEADNIDDATLLREVMNTVGKPGSLGQGIRCVVSVSMLTEGWDANTVTHVLGVRAFGTQLLCEQVVGRALRRQSYELNEDGLFDVEYADVLGIPFDFAAEPVVTNQGHHVRPSVFVQFVNVSSRNKVSQSRRISNRTSKHETHS